MVFHNSAFEQNRSRELRKTAGLLGCPNYYNEQFNWLKALACDVEGALWDLLAVSNHWEYPLGVLLTSLPLPVLGLVLPDSDTGTWY